MTGGPWWRIGWRNLGRNQRRTIITALGLAGGYFAVVFLVGWMGGLMAEMIENGTGLLSGQIQIHSREYRPERRIYDTIGGRDGADVARLVSEIAADPAIAAATPRVYAGGLISSGAATAATILMGVDPAGELRVSRILRGMVSGRAPAPGAKEILIGAEMARQLGVEVGAEVVVVAPAADGSMGNDLYIVAGVFRTGLAELDGSYAILPIGPLQALVALAPERVHEIALATHDAWLAPEAADRLRGRLEPFVPDLEVEPWTHLQPQMLEYVQLAQSWYFIVIIIVFAITVFGVANTMLMATFERRREFAVMLALGTTPWRVLLTVIAEAAALGVVSLAFGVAITFPLLAWWHHAPLDLGWLYGDFTMFGALIRPVLRIEYDWPMAAWTGVALIATALLSALYPAARAARVPPADTLSGL